MSKIRYGEYTKQRIRLEINEPSNLQLFFNTKAKQLFFIQLDYRASQSSIAIDRTIKKTIIRYYRDQNLNILFFVC
jgi:hypothetical protein